jgi:hypothetical protein
MEMNLGLVLWWIDMMEIGLKDIKVPYGKCMEKIEYRKINLITSFGIILSGFQVGYFLKLSFGIMGVVLKGYQIKCSKNHPVCTISGYCQK